MAPVTMIGPGAAVTRVVVVAAAVGVVIDGHQVGVAGTVIEVVLADEKT